MIYWQLFTAFFVIGMFSFGGGSAGMELIRSKVVSMGWLTNAEFMDIISLSEMTPGPMGINIASFVGTRIAGVPGTIIATFAYIMPAIGMVIFMAYILRRYGKLAVINGILQGLRPATVAMVVAASVKIVANAYWGEYPVTNLAGINWVAVALSAVILVLLAKKKIGPIKAMLLSGALGFIAYSVFGLPSA